MSDVTKIKEKYIPTMQESIRVIRAVFILWTLWIAPCPFIDNKNVSTIRTSCKYYTDCLTNNQILTCSYVKW